MKHASLYQQMKDLGIFEKSYVVVENPPYLQLVVERLGRKAVSLAHTYKLNGDVMRDPEIVVEFDHEAQAAEAILYQQDSLGIYQEVYELDEDGRRVGVRVKLKGELNDFLGDWLRNIKEQGFKIREARERD